MPIAAVATDLMTGEEVVIRNGNVSGVACLSPQQLMSILFFIIGLIVLLIVRQSDIHGRVVTIQPKREGVKT